MTKFSREWAMPNSETFSILPIRALLKRYIEPGMVVIDPFARNSKIGTITNDLNPETSAQNHLDATEFLAGLAGEKVRADVVLFDPPYSPRQVSECYQGVGRDVTMRDTQMGPMFGEMRSLIDRLIPTGGIVISCGWNTTGMGSERQYRLEEILIVPHGGVHNDTLVTVERKMQSGFQF
jgi:hypothetical protein